MSTETFDKKRYFVTFIDDFSRYTAVYLIRNKDEVLAKFQEFVALVSNQTEKSIKILRSDGGGEYFSKGFDNYCKTSGILHQSSAPYTPEQNGVAERMNRTLVEMIRSMLHQQDTPLTFWGEALQTAVHIRNRSPSSAINGHTPFEIWHNRLPDISYFRIFWCDAYVHIPKEKRTKLEAKAHKCKFIGYSSIHKAYRFWDLEKKSIRISRDADFDEESVFLTIDSKSNLSLQEKDNLREKSVCFTELPVFIEQENENENADEFFDAPDLIDGVIDQVGEENINGVIDQVGEENINEVVDQVIEQQQQHEEQQIDIILPQNIERRYPERIRNGPKRFWESGSARICQETEPKTLNEAKLRDDWPEWQEAVTTEYKSLLESQTWESVILPPGKNLVGSKWVFKVKENADGTIERYKARLVAQGFSQKFGIDYEDTFAPVVKYTSIRTILAIAAKRDMEIHHMDVKTAFLNSELKEDIYMRPPPGFETKDGTVFKLKKALYGLKQSSREWYKLLADFLCSLGFKQSNADSCIFVKWENEMLTIISVYVDDLIIVTDSQKILTEIRTDLKNRFKMTDLGELKYYLGLEISRNRTKKTLRISQEKYIRDILERFGMQDSAPMTTPLDPNPDKIDKDATKDMSSIPYRSAVGSIMYAMKGTRPDIAAAFSYVSRYLENPSWQHWMAVKRILRYLKGTLHYGIVYGENGGSLELYGYVDSDWGSDHLDRRSISGSLFKLYGAPISWQCKKQETVALSSTEAEYMAATLATQEAVWLRNLLQDMNFKQNEATTIFEDNQGCIKLSKDATDHSRTKHIDIKHHFIREKVENKIVKLEYVPTNENQADILTKGLNRIRFETLRSDMGIIACRLSGSIENKQAIGMPSDSATTA
jgi:hypothetical protein